MERILSRQEEGIKKMKQERSACNQSDSAIAEGLRLGPRDGAEVTPHFFTECGGKPWVAGCMIGGLKTLVGG